MKPIPRVIAGTAIALAAVLTAAPIGAGLADFVIHPGQHGKRSALGLTASLPATANSLASSALSAAAGVTSSSVPTSAATRRGDAVVEAAWVGTAGLADDHLDSAAPAEGESVPREAADSAAPDAADSASAVDLDSGAPAEVESVPLEEVENASPDEGDSTATGDADQRLVDERPDGSARHGARRPHGVDVAKVIPFAPRTFDATAPSQTAPTFVTAAGSGPESPEARITELAADLQTGVDLGEFTQEDADRVLADMSGYIRGERTFPERTTV